MRYIVSSESIVDTRTGRVLMNLSCPKWEATLHFECKVLNGLLKPKWIDDVLIWIT